MWLWIRLVHCIFVGNLFPTLTGLHCWLHRPWDTVFALLFPFPLQQSLVPDQALWQAVQMHHQYSASWQNKDMLWLPKFFFSGNLLENNNSHFCTKVAVCLQVLYFHWDSVYVQYMWVSVSAFVCFCHLILTNNNQSNAFFIPSFWCVQPEQGVGWVTLAFQATELWITVFVFISESYWDEFQSSEEDFIHSVSLWAADGPEFWICGEGKEAL